MTDALHGNIRRVGIVLLVCFAIVSLALGYWQVWRSQDLATSPSNPRVADAALNAPRGSILDRNGQVLASSSPSPQGTVRHYAEPSLVYPLGYHSSRYGDTDLEAAFSAQLEGQATVNPVQGVLSDLFHTQPQPDDLVLTIDQRIHDAAVAALGDNPGSIVALDPQTGAILAMVSYPTFDPNQVDQLMPQLEQDPSDPLLNRAIQSTYVSGSTFKAVTASAAIDLGLVDLNQRFMCTTEIHIGTYAVNCNNNDPPDPDPNYKEAFAWSSNRTFALTGVLLGFPGPMNPYLDDNPPGPYPWQAPGASILPSAQKLEDYAQRFGFTQNIPFDLPVATSQIKDPSTPWSLELLAQTAFGQGQILVTPLQMALVAATIANNGDVPTPYIVSELKNGQNVQQLHQPGQVFSHAIAADTAHAMVQNFIQGTIAGYAEPAAIPGIQVGGKTGSAEVGDGSEHSWFIGFAPADNPVVAVAVIMERKGSGTTFATPAGQQVMVAALADYHR